MTTIKCPKCGKEIDVDEVLSDQIMCEVTENNRKVLEEKERCLVTKLNDEFNAKVKEAVEAAMSARSLEYDALKSDYEASQKTLKDLKEQMKELIATNSQLKAVEATRDLEIQTQLAKAKEEALEEAKNTVGGEWKLRYEQLEKQLDQTKDALETAQKRSTQGSQQIQGDVLEEDICEYLSEAFHEDDVSRVKKGRAGADVIQKVRRFQQECGTIVWEVKNAKWNRQWISKLKEDAASASADIGILVSVNVPDEVDSFGYIDGILVTKPSYVIPIATLVRNNLMAMRELNISLMGRDERMNRLQKYITGPEFRSRITMIVEKFEEMRDDLEAEKRATTRRWAKQEKRLEALTLGTARMYGDFQGILGRAVEDIPLLEQEDDEPLE